MISASFGTSIVSRPIVSSGIRREPGMSSPVKYWLVRTFHNCGLLPAASRWLSSSVERFRYVGHLRSSSMLVNGGARLRYAIFGARKRPVERCEITLTGSV